MSNRANDSLSQADIYNNMVAGCFPAAEGLDPSATVRMLAQEVLNAQHVHVLLSVNEGHVFYLACDSRALASSPGFVTRLAAGLPGHTNHQGDGCYFLALVPNHAAALVRRGNSLKLFSNFSETVMEACVAEELPHIDVSAAEPAAMHSRSWVQRELGTGVGHATAMSSLAVLGLCAVAVLVSSGVSGYLSKSVGVDLEDTAAKANAIIESASMTQPLATELNRVQSLTRAAVAAGGWIEGYHYKRGPGERYVVSLPSWVTADAVKSVGEGVTTEAQPGSNLIWVLKRDSAGQQVKNRGPAAMPTTSPPTQAIAATVSTIPGALPATAAAASSTTTASVPAVKELN